MLDAHGSLNESQAIRLAQAAEEFDIDWFEEPVSSDNWRSMGRVRQATSIPISTGENDFTHFDFRDIIAHEAADILQPDSGGGGWLYGGAAHWHAGSRG